MNMKKIKQKALVVKLSSLAVTDETGAIAHRRVNNILSDIMALARRYQMMPVIVSSGAINIGRAVLGQGSDNMAYLQACAAVGQAHLMQMYEQKLSRFNKQVAQILLTHEDLRNKQRSLNIKNTLNELLSAGIVPIINENDSVSFDEISFGDNDQLSAMICELVSAPVLVMLTKTNGLYDADPKEPNAKRFESVAYDEALDQVCLLYTSPSPRDA